MICKYCGKLLTGNHCLHCGTAHDKSKKVARTESVKPVTQKVTFVSASPNLDSLKQLEEVQETKPVDYKKSAKKGVIIGSIFAFILLVNIIMCVVTMLTGGNIQGGLVGNMVPIYYVGFIGELFALNFLLQSYKNCPAEDKKTKKLSLIFIIAICAIVLILKCLIVVAAYATPAMI